jgi:hypothetical protein
MKWARVLLWAVGAAMCVVGILLFTDPIDVFDHVGQPRLLRETEAAASSPTSETPQLAPPNIAAQQREARPRLQEAPRPSPLEIPAQQPEPLAASPVQGALPLAPAGIEDQLNELHLNPPAQNSPHAIVPDAKATPEIAPAAESEGSATAEAIEVPSAVEGPSPAAPKDELVTITSAASVRNGPSESADVIGRAHAGASATAILMQKAETAGKASTASACRPA